MMVGGGFCSEHTYQVPAGKIILVGDPVVAAAPLALPIAASLQNDGVFGIPPKFVMLKFWANIQFVPEIALDPDNPGLKVNWLDVIVGISDPSACENPPIPLPFSRYVPTVGGAKLPPPPPPPPLPPDCTTGCIEMLIEYCGDPVAPVTVVVQVGLDEPLSCTIMVPLVAVVVLIGKSPKHPLDPPAHDLVVNPSFHCDVKSKVPPVPAVVTSR
jgi:hypothetical protein